MLELEVNGGPGNIRGFLRRHNRVLRGALSMVVPPLSSYAPPGRG